MKKIIALILALVMIMSLAACSQKPAEEPELPAIDAGNEPAAPGEGPEMDEMPAVMPDASETDMPSVDYPSTDSDIHVDYPSSDSDLPVGDNLPLTILSTVWATYAEDEMFAAAGGDYENMVMDGPGACGLNDAEALDALFGIPASALGNVASAASLMHMMNANTFTSACYELRSGVDAAAMAAELKDNILARQWMCGFPETLIVVEVEGCIVTAFGNNDIIQLFKDKLASCYTTSVLVEEPIV